MSQLLFNQTVLWKVSAAWASKHIDCTLRGIIKGCGGICCKNKSFYPAKANGGVCINLEENGCILTPADKPIKCLLYPFVIKNNSLGLYGRALTWTCKPNYNLRETSILENIKDNFIELFGDYQYETAYNEIILCGRDTIIEPSERLLRQLAIETETELQNINPIKRSTII